MAMRPQLTNIEQRLWLPLAAALTISNINGVLIVTVFLLFLLPFPELADENEIIRSNLIALAIIWAATLPIAALWSAKLWRPVHVWLRSGATPTYEQRRLVLRTPVRMLMVPATLWALSVVVFTALNSQYDQRLAVAVAIATTLGGLGTGLFTYLAVQRILRPVSMLALADAVHDRQELPGVGWRIMLSWGLGTGIPVLGIVLVSLGVLSGSLANSEREVALTGVFLGTTALVSGMLAMWISTRSLSEPLDELRAAMDRVRAGEYDGRVDVYDGSEIGLLQAGFNDMVEGLAERERLRDLFGRHVGTEIAEAALQRGPQLGGEELEVAVLFCDLVGSTQIAHESQPQEVVGLLNRFFAVMIDVVSERGGTVNKFLGDAGLCIFGAPLPHDNAAAAALSAAREIRRRMEIELPGYDAGTGVSAGQVVAGNVGSAERFEYTVIGDAVNEAARLTDLAKQEPERILASEAVVVAAGATGLDGWTKAGDQKLRGRGQPTAIYRPLDPGEDISVSQRSWIPWIKSRPQRSRSEGGGI